ncbi:hypothetical protein ACI77J_12555 [Pseudomonas sp. O64]|uniref:hypothetical protein n=1 Tax=unclassified Pseudomonas TaxID=196821 RepID=UPI00387AF5AB
MLDKMCDGTWAIYCDECGAYVSDFPDKDDEAEEEVICRDCLDKDEDEEHLIAVDDWRQKAAHALEEAYGPCPYGQKALFKWIGDEVMRLKARGVPGGEAATMELGLSYWQWLGDESGGPI